MNKFLEGPWKILSVKTSDNTPMLSIQEDFVQKVKDLSYNDFLQIHESLK